MEWYICVICVCVCNTLRFLDSPGEIKCTWERSRRTGMVASLIYSTFCPHFVYAPWNDLLWLFTSFENCAAVLLSLHMAVELPWRLRDKLRLLGHLEKKEHHFSEALVGMVFSAFLPGSTLPPLFPTLEKGISPPWVLHPLSDQRFLFPPSILSWMRHLLMVECGKFLQ